MEYPARFEPAEEDGFVITIPDRLGVSQGDTVEAAFRALGKEISIDVRDAA